MARIISVHSFRGGTGKSNTTANLAALLAATASASASSTPTSSRPASTCCSAWTDDAMHALAQRLPVGQVRH